MNHFLVLRSIKGRKIDLHDPASGRLILDYARFSKKFSGIAIECRPSVHFKKKNLAQTIHWRYYFRHLVSCKSILIAMFFYFSTCQICLLFLPLYFKRLIDIPFNTESRQVLFVSFLALFGLQFLLLVSRFMKSLCLAKIQMALSYQLGSRLIARLFTLPYLYFDRRSPHEVFMRFNAFNDIQKSISHFIIDAIWHLLMILSFLGLMIYLLPLFSLLSLIFAFVFLLVKFLSTNSVIQVNRQLITSETRAKFLLFESIRSIQAIKLYSSVINQSNKWLNASAAFLSHSYLLTIRQLKLDIFRESLFAIELMCIVYLAFVQFSQQKLSIAVLYLYLFYRRSFMDSLFLIADKFSDFKHFRLHFDRAKDFFQQPSSSSSSTSCLVPQNASIVVRSLSFSYPGSNTFIFKDIDFSIPEGQIAVIRGRSGTGKSTLMKVLAGLFQPVSGQIMIGGVPLSSIDRGRHFIASVMQEDYLMHGTLLENISFFSPSVDMDRVVKITKILGIYEHIMAMSQQFYTMTGDMAAAVSGGQRQRILIARALYHQPEILLLDEASSQLDLESERLVNTAIKSLGITCLIVAHRQEAIKTADVVISL